jgi:hypothetical protein
MTTTTSHHQLHHLDTHRLPAGTSYTQINPVQYSLPLNSNPSHAQITSVGSGVAQQGDAVGHDGGMAQR